MKIRPISPFGRVAQWLLIAIFFFGISLPFFAMVFRLEAGKNLNEKRRLAAAPTMALWRKAPTRFCKQLKDYLADNFGFRATLVRWHASVSAKHLSVSPNPKVILGKDGWLFLADEGAIEDYRCLKPFTETQLEQWRCTLERRRDWLDKQGIRYLFVVVPNAHTIYPEFLPTYITRVRDTSRLDQLVAHLRAHSTVPILDLRPVLLNAKQTERVYSRTDTHWNERGAFLGYQELFKILNDWSPALRPRPKEDFEPIEVMGPGGDLARMLGMPDVFQEQQLLYRPRFLRQAQFLEWSSERYEGFSARPSRVLESSLPNPDLPRLVVFHDSSNTFLEPFVSEHFSRVVYVWRVMGFEPDLILKEKPAIVIQQLTERHLMLDAANPLERLP